MRWLEEPQVLNRSKLRVVPETHSGASSGFPVAQFSLLKATAPCGGHYIRDNSLMEPSDADGSSGDQLIKQAERGARESTSRDPSRTVFFAMTLKVKSDDYKRLKATFS